MTLLPVPFVFLNIYRIFEKVNSFVIKNVCF